MHCPRLNELPAPPPDRIGWPWTEESERRREFASQQGSWPRISVITPSFNQGKFIEETIRSILLQGYSNLEYFVLDGGSTDGSVEIIKKYSPWINYWVSQPDRGQSDAINRGLKRATGAFATWTNSDDLLCKNALVSHISRYGLDDKTVYVGICVYIDECGKVLLEHQGRVQCLEDLLRIDKVWRAEAYRGHIDQPAVLFPRPLALSAGGLNTSNHYTMDYELWGALFLAGARFQCTEIPFGMFRQHAAQKTHDMLRQTDSLIETSAKLTALANFPEDTKNEIITDLRAYKKAFQDTHWKGTGRLAHIGLPPTLVNPIRSLRLRLRKALDT